MIHVVATIIVKEAHKAEFITAFKDNVPNVLAEDGCIEYTPAIDIDTDLPPQVTDATAVTVIEKWESLDHLKAHITAPHMLAYKAVVKDWVVSASLKVLQNA